jgi:short-subunit dehydrogenase
VTGASSGIGAQLARALARRGHGVTLVARRRARLDELARKLGDRYGVLAHVVACDLGDAQSREELADSVADLGHDVEVLCNSAGFGTAGDPTWLDRTREVDMVRLNCEAVVDLCLRYASGMASRGRGAILNVASTAAFQPLPRQATYAASKALVLSFTESLHQDLRKRGVAVTALCPGPVATEFIEVAGMGDALDKAPSFAVEPADRVAEAAIRGLERNHRVVVPGLANRLGALAGRHAPRGLLLRAAGLLYPAGR